MTNKIHYPYPSIPAFHAVVKRVRESCAYHCVSLPIIKFYGTVKIHGANAAIVYKDGEVYAQSRSRVITPEDDNCGFAKWVEENRNFSSMWEGPQPQVVAYGEWIGPGIKKGTALHKLDKPMFFLFDIFSINRKEFWLPINFPLHQPSEHNVSDYWKCEIDIDFNNLEAAQEELERLTLEVEQQCPIGKRFGLEGIGEGIVWKTDGPVRISENGLIKRLIFKTKGAKHRDAETDKIVEICPQVAQNIKDFVDIVVTDHRCEKMMMKMRESESDLSMKRLGAFLKLTANDIIGEETDRLNASSLEWKDVAKNVNYRARQWFVNWLRDEVKG